VRRRTLCLWLGAFVLPAWAGVAAAAPPATVRESGPAFGRSAWTYQDLRDSSPKYEGGYAQFDSTSLSRYARSPHGGYDSTTDKCRVCHAVHRAQGAYYLMRADSQGDACVYCHGPSGHSDKTVYDANPDGMSTTVGHRIGAAAAIPDSSVEQTSEVLQIVSADASGNVTTATVFARHADGGKNQMFRLRLVHSQNRAGFGRYGYARIGPTQLSCMSCHQPHNAPDTVWRPMAFPDGATRLETGYKLLRSSPSGSIWGPDDLAYGGGGPATVSYTRDGMRGHKAYTDFRTTGFVNPENVISAPESTLTAGAAGSPASFGPGKTIWTSPDWGWDPAASPGPRRDPAIINQYALSAWCADCHNLDIGYFKTAAVPGPAFGAAHPGSTLDSTTHPIPMIGASNGPGQCYSCHRAGLTPVPATSYYSAEKTACERCHYGTGSYAVDPLRLSGASDFPHSGETSGAALLGAWTIDAFGSVEPTVVTAGDPRVVCVRCHAADGTRVHETTPGL
jgi:hypothetical protein